MSKSKLLKSDANVNTDHEVLLWLLNSKITFDRRRSSRVLCENPCCFPLLKNRRRARAFCQARDALIPPGVQRCQFWIFSVYEYY